MALAHSCPDGTHSKLIRNGPVGTTVGVTFTCPRCGDRQTAAQIERDTTAVLRKLAPGAFAGRR